MAERAACAALVEWTDREARQQGLFVGSDPWARAGRGDGFSELALCMAGRPVASV